MEDIQARMDANELLVERLQQEEREQFTIKEKSRMLVEMIAERKRFFTSQRAEQIRNKPPTRAQLRNKMILKWLKTVEKIEDDAEKEDLRAYLDIIPRDDEAINVESLAIKYPIVDWKTHALSEDKMYYEIIRGDGSTKFYKIFTEMLDDFDRQDVLDLYRLKAQQDYTLISWRLFDSCGVHVLLMDTGIAIHMLIEKTYPLTQEMLSRMLSRRLEVDHECEMAYELLSSKSPGSAARHKTKFGDSTSSSNSLYSVFFISDQTIELAEFEIQEMGDDYISTSGEALAL
ncbi:hypothetical protein Tco_1210299 [Tanacetum coccineum]